MKKYIALLLATWQITFAFAQNNFLAVVKDAANGEVLIGAKVAVEKSNLGGITDTEGQVELKNLPNSSTNITFTYVGYVPQTVLFVFPKEWAKML